MIATSHARIYRRDGTTYGCLYSANRRFKLGQYSRSSDTGRDGQRQTRLAGRYVGFEEYVEGSRTFTYEVRVFDLRSGRLVRDVPTGPVPPEADEATQFGIAVGIGPVTALRLRATGGVAWIARNRYSADSEFVVRKADAKKPMGLAAGRDIHPVSLALNGSRLTWLQAGQERAASLR